MTTGATAAPLPRRLASLVRIEHTVFALPFAYVGAFLSLDAWPGLTNVVWVTVAMVGARTLAMSINRLVDAELDARNPRTATRELPSGALSRAQVLGLCLLSLVVFLVAVFSHVISIRLGGTTVESTIPGAVLAAWDEGDQMVAVATAVTALIAPALYILLRLYVLVPLAAGRIPIGFGPVVRALHQVSRWNMLEVLTVGGLLSLVRLAALAEAVPGPAMFALGVLTVLFAAIEAAGLRHLWWYVP